MIKIILAFVVGIIAGIIIGYLCYKLKVIEVSDNKPVQESMVANAMQLSNEIKDYIYEKDGKLFIKVVKPKK